MAFNAVRAFSGMEFALKPYRFIDAVSYTDLIPKEIAMQWTTPAYTDLRFGFEITMYIANR